MEIITAIFAFLLAIIVLVTVHEFGHYWVAKKCGVSVLNFAIGFGKTLYSWQKNETTYHIKAIPLGGFVDMLDSKKHKVKTEQHHLSFDKKNVYQRFAIVAAGPIANLILAFVLYAGIFLVGVDDIRPTIDSIKPNSFAAHAGLQSGDTFLNINGVNTPGIDSVLNAFISSKQQFNISVNNKSEFRNITMILPNNWLDEPKKTLADLLGFSFLYPSVPAVIDKVVKNSAAQEAGLKTRDKILAINKQTVKYWHDITKIINSSSSKTLLIDFDRNGELFSQEITPKINNNQRYLGISALVPEDFYQQHYILVRYDLLSSINLAWHKTYQITQLNLKMIKRILLGNASIKHINGPISVANYAGRSFQLNMQVFISFVALMSIAIAVFNLLPIPLLDGGYLFFYVIEILTGRALNQKWQNYFNSLGLLFIALLISIALYNDLFVLLN